MNLNDIPKLLLFDPHFLLLRTGVSDENLEQNIQDSEYLGTYVCLQEREVEGDGERLTDGSTEMWMSL